MVASDDGKWLFVSTRLRLTYKLYVHIHKKVFPPYSHFWSFLLQWDPFGKFHQPFSAKNHIYSTKHMHSFDQKFLSTHNLKVCPTFQSYNVHLILNSSANLFQWLHIKYW
jgi:hypothetical protein